MSPISNTVQRHLIRRRISQHLAFKGFVVMTISDVDKYLDVSTGV